MVSQRILSVAQFKTATRHWIPKTTQLTKSQLYAKAYFSSRQRCINFNNANDATLVSNDDVFTAQEAMTTTQSSSMDDTPYFEPIVFSNDEVTTASPVRRP